jgi:hypothetical protein
MIGALLLGQAQNAVSDLPLPWGGEDQLLASEPLTLSAGQFTQLKLANATAFPAKGDVDALVVSHGRAVPVTIEARSQ